MLDDGVREQILTKLTANLNIDKVILFGSFAHGTPGKNSDVDLIVVTDDDYMPKNYEDNMRNYLKVSSALRDLKRKIPIDLIVHTKPMHEKFIRLGSIFSKTVLKNGEVLYERDI